MRPPIFLSTPGTLDVFRSIEDAAAYLEPEDIPVTSVFDSDGTRLTAIHALTTNGFARAFGLPGRRVVISEAQDAPREPEKLRRLIVEFLCCLQHSEAELAAADLPRLVEMSEPYATR